jgi:hypothetical protein
LQGGSFGAPVVVVRKVMKFFNLSFGAGYWDMKVPVY